MMQTLTKVQESTLEARKDSKKPWWGTLLQLEGVVLNSIIDVPFWQGTVSPDADSQGGCTFHSYKFLKASNHAMKRLNYTRC